jgi:hypothetical protein
MKRNGKMDRTHGARELNKNWDEGHANKLPHRPYLCRQRVFDSVPRISLDLAGFYCSPAKFFEGALDLEILVSYSTLWCTSGSVEGWECGATKDSKQFIELPVDFLFLRITNFNILRVVAADGWAANYSSIFFVQQKP